MSIIKCIRNKVRLFRKKAKVAKSKETMQLDVFGAITEGYFMLAKILIKEQFDVNEVSCTGETLLITFCRTTTIESEEKVCFVKNLLNAGASVYSKDKFGRTALYYAERNKLNGIRHELLQFIACPANFTTGSNSAIENYCSKNTIKDQT